MAATLTIGETRFAVDGLPAELAALPHTAGPRRWDRATDEIVATFTVTNITAAEQTDLVRAACTAGQWEYRARTIELWPAEVDRIVVAMRGGAQVIIGGSRSHTTYFGRDGALLAEDFDEGQTDERPLVEDELRRLIAGNPPDFLEVLRRPLRDALYRALVGLSDASPLAVIGDLIEWGECLTDRALLQAILAWPDAQPSTEAAAELAALDDGNDVYHFIGAAVGYNVTTPATGRFGMRVFAALAEMLGHELPRWHRYRADFRALTGDVAGAIADLEHERAHLPADDIELPYVERALAKYVDVQLLAQIAAAPDDDAPRLVWADILTERGDPRGELIVAQCRGAKLDEDDPDRAALATRAEQLLAHHGRAWAKRGTAWARGFACTAPVRWRAAQADLDEAFAIAPPIRGVRFRGEPGEDFADRVLATEALADPRLDPITELELAHVAGPIAHHVAVRFRALRELTLRGLELPADDLALLGPPSLVELDLGESKLSTATGAFARLAALDKLALPQCQLADDDLAPIARLAVSELDLRGNAIGERGAHLLSTMRVRRLRLGGNAIGDAGASILGTLAALRTLDVSRANLTNAGVAALSDLALACLDLGDNAIDRGALDALASGRIAKTLARLVVGPCAGHRLGPDIIPALAAMPLLWQLIIDDAALDGDAAVAILDAAPNLRGLALKRCLVDDAGLAKLVAHPGFARLDVLELSHDQLGPDAGAILARAPRLPLRLFLSGNRLGDAGARALAEAPGISRVADLLLQDNAITDAGAHALVADTSLLVPTISRLCLHDNPLVTADGAAACVAKLGTRLCHPASPR